MAEAERELSAPGRIAERIAFLFLALAAGCVVAMAGSTVWDVGARYLFNAPTAWATEISTYLLIATVFLGAGAAHLAGANVRVEFLPEMLGPRARRALDGATAWGGLCFVVALCWQAALMTRSDYVNEARVFSLLLTPTWMPKAPIAIGLAGLALAIAVEIERMTRPGWRSLVPHLLLVALALLFVVLGPGAVPSGIGRLDLGSVALAAGIVAAAFVANGAATGALVLALIGGGGLAFAAAKGGAAGPVTLLLFASIAVALATGLRIAFALGLAGTLAIYCLLPVPFPMTLAERSWSGINSFSLTAVPLYVLMGALLVRSRLSSELFAVLARALARLPGGLAHAATAGCGIFAAVSGSSVATAATIGTVACPEMTRRGYSPGLAFGSVAAGGTLGILIPPSVPMIIYATTVGVSVVQLFIAGVLPGLLMMSLFMLVIWGWAMLRPEAAPRLPPDGAPPITRDALLDSGLVIALIVAVIGSLYAGLATASETGAIGAAIAALICVLRRRLTPAAAWACLAETVTVTSFIFLIVTGANILSYVFDFLKVSQQVMALATHAELGRWMVFLCIVLVYVVLGMFLDSISMLVLTLPVVFPLSQALGFDPIWLGVILVIMAEVGLVTPPVGMNLFVLQGIGGGVPLRVVAMGALPFLVAMMVTVVLLCLVPQIALWLPANLG